MSYSKAKWILLTVIFLLLTPFVFRLADMERGFDATGGEIFFPLIPFLIYAISKTVKDIKSIFRKDD